MEGSAMITMLRSIAARRVPRVVFERAIHLYCVLLLHLSLKFKKKIIAKEADAITFSVKQN